MVTFHLGMKTRSPINVLPGTDGPISTQYIEGSLCSRSTVAELMNFSSIDLYGVLKYY